MSTNFHFDPREIILEAAERSGLLKEVAELVWFAGRHVSPVWCPERVLIDELTAAFDAHIGMAGNVVVCVYGSDVEGVDISPVGTEDGAAFEAFYAKFCELDQTNAS